MLYNLDIKVDVRWYQIQQKQQHCSRFLIIHLYNI
jgi:hypothetical protein